MVRIAINGIGIAGPALAWWLKKYGHEPVLFERAPKLRTGGYIIDFWGCGYDIAEKMNILPQLHKKGYKVKELRIVNKDGKSDATLNMKAMADATNNRFVSVARSDVSSTIFRACKGITSRFGVSIAGVKQYDNYVETKLTNGSKQKFDLVVGADGLHSTIRKLVFGTQKKFEHQLGYYVAAFEIPGYKPRNALTYVMHKVPKRSISRFSLRGDKTLCLFVFNSELIDKEPITPSEKKSVLASLFGDMGWETPKILKRMQRIRDIYFDRVSQVRMNSWTKKRVALIGDAASCPSLLAGEGTGLAITQAYVLAGELHKAKGNYKQAFLAYQKKLHAFITQKQNSARGFADFFSPKNHHSLFFSNLGVKLSNNSFFAKRLAGMTLRDDIELPDYENLL